MFTERFREPSIPAPIRDGGVHAHALVVVVDELALHLCQPKVGHRRVGGPFGQRRERSAPGASGRPDQDSFRHRPPLGLVLEAADGPTPPVSVSR